MDERLAAIYGSELRLRKAANTAAVLAFLIVLLGVIGLVSGSIRRRTREIAIRKVIGASVPGIMRLFLREYLPVLLVAGLMASLGRHANRRPEQHQFYKRMSMPARIWMEPM